jgi:hypothetical protein
MVSQVQGDCNLAEKADKNYKCIIKNYHDECCEERTEKATGAFSRRTQPIAITEGQHVPASIL